MTDMTLDEQIEEYRQIHSQRPKIAESLPLSKIALKHFRQYCIMKQIRSVGEFRCSHAWDYKQHFQDHIGTKRTLKQHEQTLMGFLVWSQRNGWTSVDWSRYGSGKRSRPE